MSFPPHHEPSRQAHAVAARCASTRRSMKLKTYELENPE
jgi:hypothetical protein